MSEGEEYPLVFSCASTNDLYIALNHAFPRFTSPRDAIQKAVPGSAVLLLADNYPAKRLTLDPDLFAQARTKELRLFIEYPDSIPGLEFGSTRTADWERIIVSWGMYSPEFPRLRILSAHSCQFLPVTNAVPISPDLVVARVAGYDRAIYGLPSTNVFPILFELPERHLIVATTKLSGFVTGRYSPISDWARLWERILARLAPECSVHLDFNPVVAPACGPTTPLRGNFERHAFSEAAHWFAHSHLLVHPSQQKPLYDLLATGAELTRPPGPSEPDGDGSLGILEGYASGILPDGTQQRRLPLRADCTAESAMVLALDAALNRRKSSAIVASNLLDFMYFNSGMCAGVRADPRHPAFGLIGWGDTAPAWRIANYGDDNARVMLATALTAACLKTERWERSLVRGLLANFRTTGALGFRGDRIDLPALEQNGWKYYYNGRPINYSPHFESYLWACYLWAFHQTGFRPFLDRARSAITMTMQAYPGGWRWQNNLERAHMLLCLAWLSRVEPTLEHRTWLATVAADLIAAQQPCGAIRERLGVIRGGHYQVPQSNDEYGTTETPLLQENGDPVSDQLYTSGFALLGLHEAVPVTGDARLAKAESKLAEFLCRIQTRSRKFDWLNGTWFRAFDDQRWESWASSADVGWGAWSIESGWGNAWATAVLALRQMHTSFWDLTAHSSLNRCFETVRLQMLPEP
ncbi:MAG: hypothetical protein C5B50_30285 [Verrucomicrobia bacterium]|nr:MAG: hypothetical protein C5B50_30285 [Verrucomicrobiota bacterium]